MKKYITPDMEVTEFEAMDIITSSIGTGENGLPVDMDDEE